MCARFNTTSWSLIARVRESGEVAREATAALCQLYWQPLYVYARHSGQSQHEAEDTIQGFLLHVIEHDVFVRADADRGRFRTFLLSSLKQFMARAHRDTTRQKRMPRSGLISMNVNGAEQAFAQSSARASSPEAAFERAWARMQLDQAWAAVEAEYDGSGKSDLFHALRPCLGGQSERSMRQVADVLDMSEGAVNVAAHRLRRRFGEALREQIAQTLASADEVDDEIAQLKEVLSRDGA